jgi:hypothetical protein
MVKLTEAALMFVDCPAWMDQQGALRCGLPAEVRCRYTMRSTGGPLEAAMIRCPAGHWFNGPVESLTWPQRPQARSAQARDAAATRDSLASSHDGPGCSGGLTVQALRGDPEQDIRRPATAPAYYLGRPARLWITAMRPPRGRTAPGRPAEARTDPGGVPRAQGTADRKEPAGSVTGGAR